MRTIYREQFIGDLNGQVLLFVFVMFELVTFQTGGILEQLVTKCAFSGIWLLVQC